MDTPVARASDWGIDPARVGVLGFSAGANLAGHAAWDRGARTYEQDAELDDPRGPDFLVFVYGGGFLDPADPGKFSPGFRVPPDAPPAFFVVAHDDGTNAIEAAMLYLAYRRLDLPAELHVYAKGGPRLRHARTGPADRRLARASGRVAGEHGPDHDRCRVRRRDARADGARVPSRRGNGVEVVDQ